MGNYIVQSDVENKIGKERLVQLTDIDDDVGAVDTGKLDQAINDAEGEADSYLAKQYSVPLSSPPAVVVAKCLEVVVYNLYGLSEGGIPDDVEKRYSNAIKFFEKVSKSLASLGVDTEPTESPNEGGPASTKTKDDRVFDDDTLENY